MRQYLILGLFAYALLLSLNLQAQQKPDFFASYDCREHSESTLEKPPLLIALDVQYPDLPDMTVIFEDTIDGWKLWQSTENFAFERDRGSIPMITDLRALHPIFRDKVAELIRRCKAKGIDLAIVETFRTHAKQSEYKAMGKKYTRSSAGKSKHQYGLAIDVVPMRDSLPQWDNPTLWKKIGIEGERLGLRWGGRWRHLYDPGHFEWNGGVASHELVAGKYPTLPNIIQQYPCLPDDLRILRKYWREWETTQSSLTRK